jgi:hypothetical protein
MTSKTPPVRAARPRPNSTRPRPSLTSSRNTNPYQFQTGSHTPQLKYQLLSIHYFCHVTFCII